MYVLMAVVFVIGYLCIAFEHPLKIDKAAAAILTAVLTWTVLVLGADQILPLLEHGSHDPADSSVVVVEALRHHLGEVSEILFFLLGAMTIVELIDSHEGFKVITDRIQTRKRVNLLWIIGLITFFLSAVLDNLTTTIVMVSLLRKLIRGRPERWLYVGVVVIAANAGGAWSPIGDVTTTMLWIGTQISATGVITGLFLPSLICLLVPLLILTFSLRGEAPRPRPRAHLAEKQPPSTTAFERNLVLALGLGSLLFVPVFKTVTHLPPYMGILFGLGVLWVATEIVHRKKNAEDKHPLSVVGVLRKVDTPSVLFFLGILLAVSSLATAGHLTQVATLLRESLGNVYAINYAIGLLSAVVDNVPLVAGAMKMYPLVSPQILAAAAPHETGWLGQFVVDGTFWELLAYCAGTGGSSLIIGSAAGVAAMGMEKISFIWYLKRVSLLAFLGYTAGAATYIGMLLLS
ncbi:MULTISPECIES: sodium:proton antiporter NhaD [Stutzerimonas]|jgi:Na+/H+ antiporter NhaD/arsenite permease-like protein|uniref:sodium:proton antiporter NhaD n=1 Tax=Stutzerimonas TaxID=2901164 RepID=UPI000E8160A1|nr:sodium:proton antiporter NhaD [Stutzerimonas balearica]MBC7200837.1 sodium:proton antiporter NhaD [Stutzerimonas balearica]MBS4150856.1 sodium:proton antiporter [Stutzerimonas balearica]MCZ4128662.1 sodium:proton antiporter NhaD [Stutzerimonas balearica]HAV87799.1 sodium:proton antiporter [Pseudomonas sp.]